MKSSIVMSNIFCGQISHCVCNHKCLRKKISDYAGMYYSTVGKTLKKSATSKILFFSRWPKNIFKIRKRSSSTTYYRVSSYRPWNFGITKKWSILTKLKIAKGNINQNMTPFDILKVFFSSNFFSSNIEKWNFNRLLLL